MWVGTVGDRVVLALALAKNETVMLTNMEPLRVLGTDRSLLAFVVCLIALDSQKQRTLLTARCFSLSKSCKQRIYTGLLTRRAAAAL